MSNDYRTIEDKLKNVERYLILQVDGIRRWVVAAFALCAVGTGLSVWTALKPGDARDDVSARVSPATSQAEATPARSDDRAPIEERRGSRDTAPEVPAEPTSRPVAPAQGSEPPAQRASRAPVGFRVAAAAIATGVNGLEPIGTAERFPADTPKLYCWTRITSEDFSAIASDARHVTHRWIHESRTVRERRVEINSPSYRVYTSLQPGGQRGAWRVEVVGANGEVIATERFVVE
jgi:hypothetical protein